MASCPACRSTRVYKGYRLAPILLRLVRRHEFLCEDCNLQFRAFSLLPPKSRRRKGKKKSESDDFTTSKVEQREGSKTNSNSNETAAPREKIVLAQSASTRTSELNQTMTAKTMPKQTENPAVTNSPPPNKTQWEMPAQALEEAAARQRPQRSHRSHQICPHCGAGDTERRRRKLWEKVVFAFTNIRAYNCRICGGAFYARRKPKDDPE